jgi:hypothetical protein
MKYRARVMFGCAALVCASPAYANENPPANAITCVEAKIENIKQNQPDNPQFNVMALTTQCGAEHNWTQRQSTAALFYTMANSLLPRNKDEWTKSGFAQDLPSRVKNRITLTQLNELVLENKPASFQKILFEELAITGSKLNADDTIDNLDLAQSNAVGVKLGQLLMNFFMVDEFQKFYNDPAYQSPELLRLIRTLNPQSSELLERLK